MAPTVDRPSGEAGFTLVELLVAMTLSMLVLFAILQSLDIFTSSAAKQTRVTDANEQVRSVMDRTVRDLRQASVIVRADATDLVYRVPDTAGVRSERICVASSNLYAFSAITAAVPAAPTAACNTGTLISKLRSATSTAFSYDGASTSATPALVKNVGLTLSLDTSSRGTTSSTTLRASAARRSAGMLPITDEDLGATCNSSGALLTLDVTLPGVSPLTVTYASSGGISLGTPTGTTLQIPKGITSVVATVTDAVGATNIIRRDVQCD